MLDLSPEDNYKSSSQPKILLDKQDEQYLINNFSLLIKKIVHQLNYHATTAYDVEDMEQTALLALFSAAQRFDDIYNEAFPSYVKTKIRGAILDELRRNDWRSRSARDEAHNLDKCIKVLTNKLSRKPKDTEICEALGISLSELSKLYQSQLNSELSHIDELINDSSLISSAGNSSLYIKDELSLALKALNRKEQIILSLIYQHELNQSDVAVVLELTKARVCQLHKQALHSLRLAVDNLRKGHG